MYLGEKAAAQVIQSSHMASQDCLTNRFLLQVLDRWCMSPRTIEVLMNTYCVVQLPEEAKGLVPPEILQVSVQDTERTTQPGPERQYSLWGSHVSPL